MELNKKILLTILIVIILGGFCTASYFVYKKYFSKTSTSKITTGLPGQLFGPKTTEKAKTLDPIKVLDWTNKYRADENLLALKTNTVLVTAAQKKTDDMFTNQYFEHVSPTGVSPSDLVSATGYNYKTTGENLALGDFKDEKDLVDAWMASPGHRANILNNEYTEIGIYTGLDTFENRGKTWLAVQEFGKPLPNCKSPNSNILQDINDKKNIYESLASQINALYAEASNMNAQANDKIKQGNEIYTQTEDKTQAQPYWDEGTTLRETADADTAKAKDLQAQADSLSKEIQTESDTYNTQVDKYNTCIKQ
ncbi:TPA: CAP domain-containing protein [Candidatus Berkelbacteria bacterium]|uniref:SCP domain-containing protein n=1 Tax=Berkelbacteria bacterium GW2011_GWE1_39_12 TaxID=1618337 RepID=A0A0G4B3X5_9BACT|nr:MAG: hypothetical protein UT28_C0001G0889 [Berkelbacteria bacterium GW2011_GWE1_39_12]HBO60247.1 CAP domain-containing protein [Candidatus Berkelbacteria bacterium]